MGSSISCGRGVPGACSPMICPRGGSCMTTVGNGVRTGHGRCGMTSSGARCGWPRVATASPARGASRARPSRAPQQGGPRRRCPPTGQGPQAPHRRRYPRAVTGRGGHGGARAGPCRGGKPAGVPAAPVLAVAVYLGRSGRHGCPGGMGVGPAAVAEGPPGNRQAPGGEPWLSAPPEAVGRRAHLRVVGPLSPFIQR